MKLARLESRRFVDSLYRLLLGREVDDDGLRTHLDLLANTNDPNVILDSILSSEEYLCKANQQPEMSPKEYVEALYLHVLGRDADPIGLAKHMHTISSTGDYTIVLRELISSAEYNDSLFKALTKIGLPSWCDISPIPNEFVRLAKYFNRENSRFFNSGLLSGDAKVRYDLDKALSISGTSQICLVFFMGLGDYLMITPFFQDLSKSYPDARLVACVSSNKDVYNSPQVAELASLNPYISEVLLFKGSPDSRDWRHYDYSALQDLAPVDAIVIPLVYEYSSKSRHRLLEIYDLFRLPRPANICPPILHLPEKPSTQVDEALGEVVNAFNARGTSRLIFVHTETRSSNYAYKYAGLLYEELMARGIFVVTPNTLSKDLPAPGENFPFYHINIRNFSVVESIHLFKLLRDQFRDKFSSVTTPSLFWHVSASLNVSNLSLHHRYDEGVHNTYYPNIKMISFCDYPAIPRENLVIPDESDCEFDKNGYCHYSVQCVVKHLLWPG